ncbi:unnamed protein product [Camellia sinensis]
MAKERDSQQQDTGEELEAGDDDGPPPGWPSISTLPAKTEPEEEEEDDDDDGPPPGWTQMAVKKEEEDDDDGPPPGWQSIPPSQPPTITPAPTTPPPPPAVASGVQVMPLTHNSSNSRQSKKLLTNDLKNMTDGKHEPLTDPLGSAKAARTQLQQELPKQEAVEMGQMVCGSCQELLSYPRGARLVRCLCCQTVNYCLEEHEVGQVKCGGCAVLLMYPYGAPFVKCSSCCFVTEIG